MKQELARHLLANFNLAVAAEEQDSQEGLEESFLERLTEALADRVEFLINNDMDRLLQSLYRIDVRDRDTDAAFALGDVRAIARSIAELVIERQLQKLEYAEKFKAQGGDEVSK